MALKSLNLLGLRICTGSLDAVAQDVLRLLARGPATVAFVNMHTANLACTRLGYREALNSFDLVLNDGVGLDIAARLRGARFAHDLPGNCVVPAVLAAWPAGQVRVFLLGSQDDIIARAGAHLSERCPRAVITGTHCGYFGRSEEAAIVQRINATQSDVLLVGMGNPNQEEFLARNRAELNVGLAIGVGGLVDIWGGKLVDYPRWATRLRLHWFLRLMQEPRRLWRRYLVGGPAFLWRVLRYGDKAPPLPRADDETKRSGVISAHKTEVLPNRP
jgi:N-acetylglucosaminyldiphosphoundecaprenol N-acetyl-beta-D-mannosaminyltransferase